VLTGIGALFTLGIDQIAHHVILRIHSQPVSPSAGVVKEGGENMSGRPTAVCRVVVV
jgi:hypothetical protein